MKRTVLMFSLLSLVVFTRASFGQVDDRFEVFFELEGADCGGEVFGAAGAMVEVTVNVKLTTTAAGTSGATLPIAATGADAAELVGCDPTDPFVAQCGSRLIFGDGAIGNEVFQYLIEAVDPTKVPDDGPITEAQGPGAIYGIAFAFAPPVRLDAGTFTLGQLKAIVEVPQDEAGKEVTIEVKNGLQGAGTTKFVAITFEGQSRTPVTTSCTFTVKPRPAVIDAAIVAPDGSDSMTIEAAVGEPGRGVAYVAVDSQIDQAEGIAGAQLAIGNSPSIRVIVDDDLNGMGNSGTPRMADEFFDLVSDLPGAVDQFVPVPVDPDLEFQPPPQNAGDCDLVAGEAQGPGTTIGIIFAAPPTPGLDEFLPGNTSGPVRFVRLEFEQAEPFASDTDPDQVGTIDFTNCLQGLGVQIKNVFTVVGQSVQPASTSSLTVTFKVAQKSNFVRRDANDDGEVGDLSDAVFIIAWQFNVEFNDQAPTPPACLDAADANDDNKVNIADAVYIINAFLGGPTIGPFECGTDPDSTKDTCPPGSVEACAPGA